MAVTTFNFKRVYVWEKPVRLFHWITAFSTTILVITGLIIADPPAINANVEATNSFWFGYVRAIHFITAYILIANLIFRIYWAFAGNQFANWRNFIPYTKKGVANIIHVLKVDIFLMKDKEQKLHNISIGHNYLAAFSYFIMTLFFILQVMTGLALIADTSTWFLPHMFKWVSTMFNGDITTRYIHHVLTWLFIAFVVVHVYLVLFHDYVEARGEASSMISGFKFIRSERVKEKEADIIDKAKKQMWEGVEEKDKKKK
ncbi:MAG: Ni/Fe-hydrogenase, b-type cytochrome subunit [Lutibacter sp.]|uniref:Ni/Fe-hydrogenase, b-type cytochrome subunit n=1 Tax=Lutibacter sp. TaxID=1925666 RepID=UPI00299DC8A9|nr:Ni/Fe-hydrogenase, b-type cytochrome subunit [Lutibacter sp.]MDX1828550.1 Ni/Fe-hydrogenase, b-type cytochrome subunit [Lutibacter sp.]